jgi:filamentous hemagglutinin
VIYLYNFNYVELRQKIVLNGENGYELIVDGIKLYTNIQEGINYVRLAVSTNAIIIDNRYLRLKRGTLSEQVITTMMVTRNGLDYINPAVPITIEEDKFTKYLLNPNNKTGKHKAYVFDRVLGYNLSNYKQLIKAIRGGLTKYPVVKIEASEHGLKYTVIMQITGTKGRAAVVTGWIEFVAGELRFTSARVDKKGRT